MCKIMRGCVYIKPKNPYKDVSTNKKDYLNIFDLNFNFNVFAYFFPFKILNRQKCVPQNNNNVYFFLSREYDSIIGYYSVIIIIIIIIVITGFFVFNGFF